MEVKALLRQLGSYIPLPRPCWLGNLQPRHSETAAICVGREGSEGTQEVHARGELQVDRNVPQLLFMAYWAELLG